MEEPCSGGREEREGEGGGGGGGGGAGGEKEGRRGRMRIHTFQPLQSGHLIIMVYAFRYTLRIHTNLLGGRIHVPVGC